MSDCIPCQKANSPIEAKIAKAEQRGRVWAAENNQSSFHIVKQINGAYTWKDPKADISRFELITTVYV